MSPFWLSLGSIALYGGLCAFAWAFERYARGHAARRMRMHRRINVHVRRWS